MIRLYSPRSKFYMKLQKPSEDDKRAAFVFVALDLTKIAEEDLLREIRNLETFEGEEPIELQKRLSDFIQRSAGIDTATPACMDYQENILSAINADEPVIMKRWKLFLAKLYLGAENIKLLSDVDMCTEESIILTYEHSLQKASRSVT